jgi:GABA permease
MTRVLLVANTTALDGPLLEAVRERAQRPAVSFHLVVPATPRGLHRVVDPEVAGLEDAQARLAVALPLLSQAAGQIVTGHVGDANALSAVEDAVHLRGFDEIIISTLPATVSRWLRLDVPSKLRALGLPVRHVTSVARAGRPKLDDRAVPRSASLWPPQQTGV